MAALQDDGHTQLGSAPKCPAKQKGPGGGSGVQDGQSSRLCQILNGPPAHLASVLLVGSLLPILLLCAETMGEWAEGTMNSKLRPLGVACPLGVAYGENSRAAWNVS